MTDYSHLVPTDIQLDRSPVATDCAVRSWDELYLAVDEDGVSLHTTTCHGGDATPIEVWHGRVRHYTIASAYRGSAVVARDTLAGDLREGGLLAGLLDRIQIGLSVEWSGNNHIGRLTADAEAAEEDLEAMLNRDEGYTDTSWSVWDTEDWLVGEHGMTAETTNERIAALAAEYEAQAVSDHVRLASDVSETLTEIRDRLREEAAEEAAQ